MLTAKYRNAKDSLLQFREYAVVTNDIKSLIDYVIRERRLERDRTLIRMGLDGGGGFMKVCMSIFDLGNPLSSSSKGKLSKTFKDSGVKKVLITAIVPGVQENYINMKRLWHFGHFWPSYEHVHVYIFVY